MSASTTHMDRNTIVFTVEYFTRPGQQVVILGNHFQVGDWNKPHSMVWKGAGLWTSTITFNNVPDRLEYKYGILDERKVIIWEAGKNRILFPKQCHGQIDCLDTWKSSSSPEEGYLYTSLFSDTLFARPNNPYPLVAFKSGSIVLRFVIRASLVAPDQEVFVCGSHAELGSWRPAYAKQLYYSKPDFIGEFSVPLSALPLEFKFMIKNSDGSIAKWEEGNNRIIKAPAIGPLNTVVYSSIFKRSDYNWRGAGIVIPIFSIRTNTGLGVGEFIDLKYLVDLGVKLGIKMIQVLPINDTSCYNTWRDSYPYSALSVYALHPLYLHIPAITSNPQIQKRAAHAAEKLNALTQIDYEGVMKTKMELIRAAYEAEAHNVLVTSAFADFMERNKTWLIPYAVFKSLATRFQTTDFYHWPEEFRRVSTEQIEELSQQYKQECDVIYFIQFHLHLQLLEASTYARQHGIGIKGDLPIGVNLRSVDCWVNPHLFNSSMSTGAPPDQFSEDGQNWGFPTYNWEMMKKDGYKWWKARLRQMSLYFQVFRIDHILGFFRIWEIPRTFESGLMGHFYPSIPVHKHELESRGLWDIERLTVPFIPEDAIRGAFGDKAQYIFDVYLDRLPNGNYKFKEQYDTEKKIIDYIDGLKGSQLNDINPTDLKNVFLYFVKNVLFLPDISNPQLHFFPRINLNKTLSYYRLDVGAQENVWQLYLDYYYRRQEDMWGRTGDERLPMMKMASDMLVCGEDLGMLPDCIFPIMKKLSILGLRVQRMPPDSNLLFAHPNDYPYMTVCTTSSHDCSTIRGWWEENRGKTQKFFNEILGESGPAPYYCDPWICRKIVEQHMWSPSMWAVFPIQDLFALIPTLRVDDPTTEQINQPSNPQHYWRYRMHVTVEDLIADDRFTNEIFHLISVSGRNK